MKFSKTPRQLINLKLANDAIFIPRRYHDWNSQTSTEFYKQLCNQIIFPSDLPHKPQLRAIFDECLREFCSIFNFKYWKFHNLELFKFLENFSSKLSSFVQKFLNMFIKKFEICPSKTFVFHQYLSPRNLFNNFINKLSSESFLESNWNSRKRHDTIAMIQRKKFN